MPITIIAKKALGFRNNETNEIVTVRPLDIAQVPDWVVNDSMYKWGLAEGAIQAVDSSPAISVREITAEDEQNVDVTKKSNKKAKKTDTSEGE